MIELALAVQSQPGCLSDGDFVSGEFHQVETRHFDMKLRQAFIVTEQPVCLAPVIWPDSPSVRGRWIQVAWLDGRTSDPAPGDFVTVLIEDCHEPATTWHIGDIICDARLVSPVPNARN